MAGAVPLWAQSLPDAELETAICALEQAMPQLQMLQRGDPFAIANAWAERYDAIVRRTPADLLPAVEARLRRVGIRWGVITGPRVTTQFPALRLPRPRLLAG